MLLKSLQVFLKSYENDDYQYFLNFGLFLLKNEEFSPKISFYAYKSVLFYFTLVILLHLDSWKVFLKVFKKC